jgi:isoaspartyl peptidase/L-asparaginase-like protein (Ntn-hydrolase superfamily)
VTGPGGPVIAIHAGAGDHADEIRGQEAECREALLQALQAGSAALQEGLDAIQAVQAAVAVMENFELFNAGRGATLCSDGSVEMSAALMRGSDRAAGAMAVLRHTENPIAGARAVLDSPHVLLVGPPADEFAARAGVPQRPQEYFATERQRERLDDGQASRDRATVGAVCLDGDGVLAAGTSTGGIRAQPPGRVGDAPVFGAGTWADAHAAISCTGDGEAFVRCSVARQVATLIQAGATVAEAAEQALQQVADLQFNGGLIAVDGEGSVALPYITQIMPRGLWREGQEPKVWVL